MYGEYCSNHEKALRLLMELNKIPNIRTFLLVSRHSSSPLSSSSCLFFILLLHPSTSSNLSLSCIFMSIFTLPTMTLDFLLLNNFERNLIILCHMSLILSSSCGQTSACPLNPLTLFSLLPSSFALHFFPPMSLLSFISFSDIYSYSYFFLP